MSKNSDVGEVGVKIAALNGLYWTNILGVTQVASHIVSLDIDAELTEDDVKPDLIERIAKVEIGGKRRRNYSFATKYCSMIGTLVPLVGSLVGPAVSDPTVAVVGPCSVRVVVALVTGHRIRRRGGNTWRWPSGRAGYRPRCPRS
ncbi:hypothetical protein GCM10022225_83020 [Plantactinospora mayteni]|uniref:Uncharacterized protein n=1 Tax=Plantactinospora mayteni TaxID=566021 RepID=A0ABQ4F4D6_9ACTN|nr:hypothetical protein Pma05_83570 [Plantactinospora mayteni]